jgi:hypothetical protein
MSNMIDSHGAPAISRDYGSPSVLRAVIAADERMRA